MMLSAWNRAQSPGWCWKYTDGKHWSFWTDGLLENWVDYHEIPLATAWDFLEFL